MASEKRPGIPVNVSGCSYCGSTNIVRHIEIGQTADAGRIGLTYRARFRLGGTEPLFADVCDDCGSLLRIFVDTVGRHWVEK